MAEGSDTVEIPVHAATQEAVSPVVSPIFPDSKNDPSFVENMQEWQVLQQARNKILKQQQIEASKGLSKSEKRRLRKP